MKEEKKRKKKVEWTCNRIREGGEERQEERDRRAVRKGYSSGTR